jgi:hypothetical protein
MKTLFLFIFLLISPNIFSQVHFPWENPLMISESTDGITFNSATFFQDSSGVPCMVRWKGDTLVCAFQWFRIPQPSPTWDRVAVKFSYDNGINWTLPVPISINGLPGNYHRPFDPTLAVVNDSIRIYFSSSDGMPVGLDSSINTYSAISSDGINYLFEPFPRYDHPTTKVIDPAVIFFNGQWHYTSPAGAPQDGAYHCTGNDGLHFSLLNTILSDPMHNWTGNLMVADSGELRFYGSGQHIWFNTSYDGNIWLGYTNTNLVGGDPSIIRVDSTHYIAIYVGQPYSTNIEIEESKLHNQNFSVQVHYGSISVNNPLSSDFNFTLYSETGAKIISGISANDASICTAGIKSGIYFLSLEIKSAESSVEIFKIIL